MSAHVRPHARIVYSAIFWVLFLPPTVKMPPWTLMQNTPKDAVCTRTCLFGVTKPKRNLPLTAEVHEPLTLSRVVCDLPSDRVRLHHSVLMTGHRAQCPEYSLSAVNKHSATVTSTEVKNMQITRKKFY